MKKSNRGFTLIELIVVLTILGIAAGLVGLTVGTTVFAKTKGTATYVNMLISECRMGCLTKTGNVYLRLTLDDNKLVGNYYEADSVVSTDSFSISGITVNYTTQTGSADPVSTTLTDATSLDISFDRSTGGLKQQSDGSYCTSIVFTAGRVYTIEFVPITGMHWLV